MHTPNPFGTLHHSSSVKRDVESVRGRLCELEEGLMAGMRDTMRLQEM